MSKNLYNVQTFQNLSFGGYGFRVLTAGETSVAGENFGALQVVADAVISATSNAPGGDASITSLTLDAGTSIYGDFSAVTVTSGTVIGYIK